MTLFIISLFWSGMAVGQGTSSGRHTAGGFAGFTDRFDTDFTFGGEYEYRMQGPWSVGGLVEYTPNVIRGDDFTLLLGTAHYRPPTLSRLKFTGGAGVEFKDFGGDDLRLRLGTGYDLFHEGSFTLTPRVAIDFGDGDENIVLGISALRRF
jgi:hypothetical protein